ncbi:hypothetical protein [Sulfuricaulis limicola]|uniref:hypothetical protein n=1 Tax=Sulfuricaulis limicola TaxID=1620215 RepID=UPI0011E4C9E7|nr:hypothetical protein [Sulfuricaulis limicola]
MPSLAMHQWRSEAPAAPSLQELHVLVENVEGHRVHDDVKNYQYFYDKDLARIGVMGMNIGVREKGLAAVLGLF